MSDGPAGIRRPKSGITVAERGPAAAHGLVIGQLPRRRGSDPPRTAFVLAGGGNRGALQVGMLDVLVEAGIRPDMLLGASVGAINAAAFAADPSAAGVHRLAQTWRGLRADTIFPHHHYSGWRFIARRDAVYPTAALRELIHTFLSYERLEDARVPLEVVAASTDAGIERWIGRGSAVDALLASAAIPGVFPPVTIDGEILIDGGVLDDVPISRAFARGAERVFALLCGPVHPDPVEAHRPVDALLAAFAVAVRGRFLREIEAVPEGRQLIVIGADVPELAGYWDFSRTEELIVAGTVATREILSWLPEDQDEPARRPRRWPRRWLGRRR